MMTDDEIIASLARRIADLEARLDEVQRHQVGWRVRGTPVRGAYPRRLPDWPGLRISQPLVTMRSR
jgi:hypothetical protein